MEPLPPSISPYQMSILRVVTAMAWADGELEPDEITVMLEQLTQLFAPTSGESRSLINELRSYLDQNLGLEESLKHLTHIDDRRLVLRLSYQVICASRRHQNEPLINLDEAEAYQKLIKLLNLSAAEVAEIESEISKKSSITDVVNEFSALIKK